MYVRVGLERKLSAEELMLLNCGVLEDFFFFLILQYCISFAISGVTQSRTRLKQLSNSSIHIHICGASLIAQLVKNPPAMQDTPV